MPSRPRHVNRITSNAVKLLGPPTTERNSNRTLSINQLTAHTKGQSMELLTAEERPNKDLCLPRTQPDKRSLKLKGDSSPEVNTCFRIFDNPNAMPSQVLGRRRKEQQVISKGSG